MSRTFNADVCTAITKSNSHRFYSANLYIPDQVECIASEVFQKKRELSTVRFPGMFCSFICGSSTAGRGYRFRCFFPVLFPRKSFSFQSDLFCPEGCIPGELPHEKCFVFHGFQDFHNPLGSIFSMFISDVSRPS